MSLLETVRELCRAVDGVDWDAALTDASVKRMLRLAPRAPREELDAALAVIVERVARSQIEDGDGVAHVAMSGGTLVEHGAEPGPLAEVLLAKLPAVLSSARAFADRCRAELDDEEDAWEDVDDSDVIAEVDGLPITRPIFRELLRDDQGGGCSLVYLPQWVLPSVASWTRDRDVLARATRDEALGDAAHAMQRSEAHWIHKLVAAQLDATWRVLCPDLDRGFLVRLDGITTNFDLKALVAEALLDAGVPGERNPRDVIDVVRGKRDHASRDYVVEAFDFHTHGALEHLRGPRGAMPLEHVVWGEGVPTEVPIHDGLRTILITPITIERTWSGGRPFSALHASARVERELARDELAALLGDAGSS